MTALPIQATTFHTHRLSNGLQVLAQRMPDMESVAVEFYVRTGSRDEHDPRLYGISHFLEHMVFKGTARRGADDITLAFNRMGAEFNAYTSFEETVYFAHVLGDQLPPAIDLLADLMRPRLDAADFDRERGVIIEEIVRGEDQPTQVAGRQFYQSYFAGTSLGHDVIGSKESIGAMQIEWMRDYWRRRYAANNSILAVAGNLEWRQVVELAERYCGSWQTGDEGHTPIVVTPRTQTRVIARPLQQQHILLGYPFPAEQSKDYYAASMGADILGDGSGSRMYWNITHKGLAESAVAQYSPFDGLGMLFFYLATTSDAAPEVLRLTRAEIASIETDGVHPDELERARAKLIGHVVLDGESTMRRMANLPHSWLIDGRLKTLEEDIADIEAVTVEDVNRVFQTWSSVDRLVMLTMGPREDLAL
jgi:predicted Zn-dependent peptidase